MSDNIHDLGQHWRCRLRPDGYLHIWQKNVPDNDFMLDKQEVDTLRRILNGEITDARRQ